MPGLHSMVARTTQGLRWRWIAARLERVEREREQVERLPAASNRGAALARAHLHEALCVECVRLRHRLARLESTGA